MAKGNMYDVLIIGGGPAGLSAALTLYRQLHTVMILDTAKPRNAFNESTHCVPGWGGKQAEDMREAAREELLQTGLVDFRKDEATAIQQDDKGFEVTTSTGNKFHGRKLLIAVGKQHNFPDIPGYLDNYPHRIFHCMFTFGYECRGSERAGMLAEGVLGIPFHTSVLVGDAKKFAKSVTVFTNGKKALAHELSNAVQHSGVTFDDRRILEISRTPSGLSLKFDETGSSEEIQFLVHQPDLELQLPLIKQLGLEIDAQDCIKNNAPFHQTDIPGIYVAGDCATPFKLIPVAISTGAQAAAGIARAIAFDDLAAESANKVKVSS
ncbi:hypothetical protein GGR57DRAFT_495109 [Xylariaceae sp. FL1272]|nr:hypothetical protein GGR57DRAFT_495109 [Xylariaceae sp. FL1272]